MKTLGIFGAAAALASIASSAKNQQADHRPSRPSGFDPRINYHTDKPHEHKREIARRLRQAARRAS